MDHKNKNKNIRKKIYKQLKEKIINKYCNPKCNYNSTFCYFPIYNCVPKFSYNAFMSENDNKIIMPYSFINFSRDGKIFGPYILRNDLTSFILVLTGIYKITFFVASNTPNKLKININGVISNEMTNTYIYTDTYTNTKTVTQIISTQIPNSIVGIQNNSPNIIQLDNPFFEGRTVSCIIGWVNENPP